MKFYQKLFFCILLCVGGGWLSGLATEQGIKEWYVHLNLPIGTPPNSVFPVMWTFLYLLMAVSLALLWSSDSLNKKTAIFLFMLQLILNFTWSWLFFGLRSPGLALVDIVLLWGAILATIFAVKKHSSLAAFLLLPYFIWVTYALYLNFSIWLLN